MAIRGMHVPGWNTTETVTAPFGEVVMTKIHDDDGERNVAKLLRVYGYDNLWFLPDKSMYVYYTPTHWRHLPKEIAA